METNQRIRAGARVNIYGRPGIVQYSEPGTGGMVAVRLYSEGDRVDLWHRSQVEVSR